MPSFNFLDAQYYIFPPINGYNGSSEANGNGAQESNDTASDKVKDFLYYAKEKTRQVLWRKVRLH